MQKIPSILFFLAFLLPFSSEANHHKSLDADDIEVMKKELSNWGRWGEDDQKGAR